MPLHPELIVDESWPDASTRRRSAAQLTTEPWFDAYWPLPALPSEMGYIQEAELIPDDAQGRYFARVSVGVFDDYVHLTGQWEVQDEDASSEVELGYEELAHLMGEDHLLRLYLEDVTPAGATRRVAGFLLLRPTTEPPDFPDLPDEPDLPY